MAEARPNQIQALDILPSPEQDSLFPIHIKDGISNSHLKTSLGMLQQFHTLGNEQSIPAYKQFMDCFAPIQGETMKPTGNPETLWDQIGPAIHSFKDLYPKEQDQVAAFTDLLLWSLEHTPQERKLQGETRDISKEVRDMAAILGNKTETWEHIRTRKQQPLKYQRDIPLPTRVATGLTIATWALTSCGPVTSTITPETTKPIITLPTQITESPSQTEQPILQPTPVGPEATAGTPSVYPTSLSVEDIESARPLLVDAPSSLTNLPDVQAIISKHTEFAREKGLIFDHMEVKYVPSIQRWYIYPVDTQGNIVGWLELKDDTSQTGWRFAEQPTWDSKFSPSKDEFRFGLPALHDSRNHFEIDVIGGSTILVEVTPEGDPQFWNSITMKTTLAIEGAVPQKPEYTFGLKEGMTIAECNKLIINKDGTIPEEFLKQERAWVAANRPAFQDMQKWGYAPRNVGLKDFPLPIYNLPGEGIANFNPPSGPYVVSCSTLPDGSLVLGLVINPYAMPDRASVTSETIPIFHVAVTQAGTEWHAQHAIAHNQLGGSEPGIAFPSISEIVAILSSKEKLSTVNEMNIWTVAATWKTDVNLLDPSFQSLKNIMELNKSYVGNHNPEELVGFIDEGQGLLKVDILNFMSTPNVNKVELGKQISNRLIPTLTITFRFQE